MCLMCTKCYFKRKWMQIMLSPLQYLRSRNLQNPHEILQTPAWISVSFSRAPNWMAMILLENICIGKWRHFKSLRPLSQFPLTIGKCKEYISYFGFHIRNAMTIVVYIFWLEIPIEICFIKMRGYNIFIKRLILLVWNIIYANIRDNWLIMKIKILYYFPWALWYLKRKICEKMKMSKYSYCLTNFLTNLLNEFQIGNWVSKLSTIIM